MDSRGFPLYGTALCRDRKLVPLAKAAVVSDFGFRYNDFMASELSVQWLSAAIEQAEKSWNEGGIPIGSVLVDPAGNGGKGEIVARGHNMRVQSGDPTAHAEVACVRNAGRRRDWNRLVLVSTLSPCPMCSGTAILFKIPRVIVGENRTFLGAEDWMRSNDISVSVLDDARCVALMERMKREKPDLWAEDIGE